MINLLIKKFIKDYKDTDNPSVRTAYGKLLSIVGILCNIVLFGLKFFVGTVSGSVSITADAVNNLSDASSSIISLVGFKLSERPADAGHPYGHGRYEYISGILVAVLILVIGLELLKSSVEKLRNPAPVEFTALSAVVLIASILVKAWMMLYNKKIGKEIASPTLVATSADSRNDVITTLAVLVAAVISHYTGFELDGFIGLGVAAFILISGFGLVVGTIDPVLGKAPDRKEVQKIRDKILSYPGVLGTHDLMIHDYGPGRQFASVHVEMAAEDDVLVCHDVIDNIEQDFLRNDGLHIVVHYDPICTKDDTASSLRAWLSDEVKIVNPDITIHDLRVVLGTTHTNIVFDCVKPAGLGMTDGELKAAVTALVRREHPDYNCVITVDESFDAMPH